MFTPPFANAYCKRTSRYRVLKRITLRGSIVGTRKDLTEALAFAAEGKVKAHIRCAPLEDVNSVFHALKVGAVDGRMVLDMSLPARATEVASTAASV